jgi:predicted Zn-dependent protease
MDYMTQAGYDPEAMLGVMRILGEASQGGRAPVMLCPLSLLEFAV